MKRRKDDFDVIAELPGLKRYALVLTRDAAEAEDLLQETMLRAWKARDATTTHARRCGPGSTGSRPTPA